ncbi:hypothetical protein CISIN_1g034775mg [Citrus sinensis]|uniref:Uncharacterized protein n=1 Tax=Citrus sinensis TaxID=2711 RepID=A0A067GCP1_CITSI|nr:hypothetical protein CISIN_1g034775mg [Citrus sinensis]
MAYTRHQTFETNQTDTVKWKELEKLLNDISNNVIVFKSSISSKQIVINHNCMLTDRPNNTNTNVLNAVIDRRFHHHNSHYHQYS